MAIDITVISFETLAGPSVPQTPLHRTHRQKEILKLNCSQFANAQTNTAAHTIAQEMISNQLVYVPFTVDPFGDIGPAAHTLLHGPNPSSPYAYPSPTQAGQHTQRMWNQLQHAPQALLPKANKALSPPASTPSFAPSRWAIQTLALNLSTGLATHIATAIRACESPSATTPPQLDCHGTQYPTSLSMHNTLNPLPHYLHISPL